MPVMICTRPGSYHGIASLCRIDTKARIDTNRFVKEKRTVFKMTGIILPMGLTPVASITRSGELNLSHVSDKLHQSNTPYE
jgi:hypothetical protein